MIREARVIATLMGLAVYGESASRAQPGEDQPVLLSWVTPKSSDCPDATYVLTEIRRYVGAGAVVDRAPISANATIRTSEAGGFQLILKTADGKTSGERTFQDQSCRALADAAVVILAWMVAPDAMAARSSSPQPQAAHSEPPVSAAPTPPPPLKGAGPMPYLGLGTVADVGTLPDPALGAEVQVGLSLERLRLGVGAAYWPARRKTVAALASGEAPGATFTLWTVGLRACLDALPRPSTSRLGLLLCAGPELDILSGAGFGVTAPATASKLWLSFSAAIEGRLAIARHLKVLLSLAGVLPTEREHFALRGIGEVHRPSAVGGRGTLGFELEL